MTSSRWVPQACIAGITETKYLFATRKLFGVGNRDSGIITYLRKDLSHLDSVRSLTAFIQWRCCTMAKFRWNPKPSVCFQRNGVGTILVIGKELIQFNVLYEPVFRKDVETHYQGIQEAMLLVGASVTEEVLIEGPEDDST